MILFRSFLLFLSTVGFLLIHILIFWDGFEDLTLINAYVGGRGGGGNHAPLSENWDFSSLHETSL